MPSGRRAVGQLAQIVLVVGVATAASGCGSGSSAGPAATVRQFYSALGNGEGNTVCSLLTPSAQQRYITGSGSCVQNVSVATGVPGQLKQALKGLQIGTATVHGSTATVPITLPQKRSVLTLQQSGGRWVITNISNP